MPLDTFESEARHRFAAKVANKREEYFRSESIEPSEALYECRLLGCVSKACNAIILRNYKGEEFGFEDTGASEVLPFDEEWTGCFEEIEAEEAWRRIRHVERGKVIAGQGTLF